MDVGLSDDQRQLADAARSVLREHSPPSLTRAAYDDPEAWRPSWAALVELGWTGVIGAEPDADDVRNMVVLMEAAGAATLAAPLLSTVGLSAGALRACGEAAAPLLEEVAGGAVAAMLDGPEGSRLPGPCLSLDGGRVRGRAQPVRDAGRADFIVGLATDAASKLHVVAVRPGSGISVSPLEAVDPSHPVVAVDVDAEPEFCAPVDQAAAVSVPLIAAAGELVGVASAALSLSVEHAKTRNQFGQPIGAFQAVKHRLADAYVAIERARSLTYAAAGECTGAAGSALRSGMLAKAAANDAATSATRAAVSVHGAIAQTWEHDAHLFVRRAWQSSALLGETTALYAAAARDFVSAATA
jgi:alkylation response protein AidB-like acyl-CoA dehydrogenase